MDLARRQAPSSGAPTENLTGLVERVAFHDEVYAMLARNPPYTGVTRGKTPVVLVGQREAVAMAVRNGGQRRRWSKLREWLTVSTAGGPP